MKKKLFLCSVLLISILFYLNATETRITALGSEKNLLIDDTNIFIFPSSLERFIERGIVEYGFYPFTDSIAYLSLLKELGRLGNIGMVFNKRGIPVLPSTSNGTLIAQPDALFNIYYSLRINDALSVGISGGYGIAASNEDEEGTANDVTNESSASSSSISISYLIGAKQHLVELSGGAKNYIFTYKQGDDFSFENDNKISTEFSGRFLYNLNDYFSLIPFFNYSTLDLSSREAAYGQITPTDIKRVTTITKAGLGLNFAPFEENRVILGVIYNSKIFEKTRKPSIYDTTITENNIPEIVGGIESELKSWLTVRVGMKKSLLIHKLESSNGIKSIMTDKDAPFKINLGLGIRLGSLELDAVINEDLPFTYGYFISGEENPIFTKVSATYLF